MQEFLSILQKVPSNILFSDGPKLDCPSFRWAPKTLIASNSNFTDRWRGKHSTPDGYCDGQGLKVRLPGYFIRIDERKSGNTVWVRDVEGGISFHAQSSHQRFLAGSVLGRNQSTE